MHNFKLRRWNPFAMVIPWIVAAGLVLLLSSLLDCNPENSQKKDLKLSERLISVKKDTVIKKPVRIRPISEKGKFLYYVYSAITYDGVDSPFQNNFFIEPPLIDSLKITESRLDSMIFEAVFRTKYNLKFPRTYRFKKARSQDRPINSINYSSKWKEFAISIDGFAKTTFGMEKDWYVFMTFNRKGQFKKFFNPNN